MPSSRPSYRQGGSRRTVWEEGHHPGRLVARAAVFILLVTTLLSVLVTGNLGTGFDVVFVLVCIGSAMWVSPRDFFVVGVMPPLLLAGTVAILAWFDRGAVARPDDTLVQAFVSGLAHHAKALVIGYGLTLGLLALRQVALRRHGALRRPRPRTDVTVTAADAPAPQAEVMTEPPVEAAPGPSLEDFGRPQTGTTAGSPT